MSTQRDKSCQSNTTWSAQTFIPTVTESSALVSTGDFVFGDFSLSNFNSFMSTQRQILSIKYNVVSTDIYSNCHKSSALVSTGDFVGAMSSIIV